MDDTLAHTNSSEIDLQLSHIDRFHIIGDTQVTGPMEFWWKANDALQATLLEEMTRRQPKLVLHLGDMVTWGFSSRLWNRFDTLMNPLVRSGATLLPVLGNHDLLVGRRARQHIETRFPFLQHGGWYSFVCSGVGFLALNSNFSSMKQEEREAQQHWLTTTLARWEQDSTLRSIVAYWHHPPCTNSRLVRPSHSTQNNFVGVLSQSKKVIAVLSGHCHAYEHFCSDGIHFFVSGGGGGPSQKLERRPHKRRYVDLFEHSEERGFVHFFEAIIHNDYLEIEVVRALPHNKIETVDHLTLPFFREVAPTDRCLV